MTRKGGLTGRPDALEWLHQQKPQPEPEPEPEPRIRLRLDVPQWLKRELAAAAHEQNTSSSQMGALLIAWGLMLYRRKDPELLLEIDAAAVPNPAINTAVGMALKRLQDSVTDLAEPTDESLTFGAKDGAKGKTGQNQAKSRLKGPLSP